MPIIYLSLMWLHYYFMFYLPRRRSIRDAITLLLRDAASAIADAYCQTPRHFDAAMPCLFTMPIFDADYFVSLLPRCFVAADAIYTMMPLDAAAPFSLICYIR